MSFNELNLFQQRQIKILEELEPILREDRALFFEAVMEKGAQMSLLTLEEQKQGVKIKGCISQVTLVLKKKNDLLLIKASSNAQLVRGLLALFCSVFHKSFIPEVVATPFFLWSSLKLEQILTPQRFYGIQQLYSTFIDFLKNNEEHS